MIKFALCDDNSNTRIKFSETLYKVLEKNQIDGEVVFSTDNPDDFFNFVVNNHVDVALLDVDLKAQINGIDLAKKIRDINTSMKIVFITAHIEYIMLSFKVQTFDYLVKPVTFEKLEECIQRLAQFTYTENDNFIKIKAGPVTHMINIHDIIYIEKLNSKTNIYTNSEILETYYTLEEVQQRLPLHFKRCHKSYVINTKKVTQINTITNEVTLSNLYKCFVGRKYKKEIMSSLK